MLYMTADDGNLRIIILESANLDRIREGHPAKTPDNSVLIVYCPDPQWLAEQILVTDGDAAKIGKLIDEAAKRPEKPTRPGHPKQEKRF